MTKTLFLAWQGPDRAWFPVGLLEADVDHSYYAFRYTKGALDARRKVGFEALAAFPDLHKKYESSELFPLFRNRVLDSNRKDFFEYLKSLDLEPSESNPIEILALTGGTRETDNLEVFPKIQKRSDGSFACRFFLHGLRHSNEAAQSRAMALLPGERLGISVELNNPKTGFAIQITTSDYHFVGWAPRYLVFDLLKAIATQPNVIATVIRVNKAEAPISRRVLVELSGSFPPNVEPMSSEEFQPLEDRQTSSH